MKTSAREQLRKNRKRRVKNRVQNNKEKPRLTVFRSAKHIYAQIIDDKAWKTLLAESTMSPAFREKMKNGGFRVVNKCELEIKDEDKPAFIAETISLVFP